MAKSRRKETTATQALGSHTVAEASSDRVALRAYELYLARGGGDGRALEDWLTAEREVSGRIDKHSKES